DRLRSREISDERHNQIAFLHALDCLELILRSEEIPVARYTIGLRHQIGIARHSPEVAIAADKRITQVGTRLEKRLRDVTNSGLVCVRELEAFLVFQVLHNTSDIFLEECGNGATKSGSAKQHFGCGIRR